MPIIIYYLALVSFCIGLTNSEFYSSVHEMTKLVRYETFFVKYMEKFIIANENKLDFLKARLGDFERERREADIMGAEYFESPVNKYLLTKRLTMDWERVENLMQYKSGDKLLIRIDTFVKDRPTFPNETELEGATIGLLRLQDIYRLKTRDIAAGLIQGISYGSSLKAHHCYDIGRIGVANNRTLLGHSWLMEALDKLEQPDEAEMKYVERPTVLFALAGAKQKLGDFRGTNETFAELRVLQPENETIAQAHEEFIKSITDDDLSKAVDLSSEHKPVPASFIGTDAETRYKFTCSGHIKQTPSEMRDLRCGYLTETHPFLTIAPLKVEELNHDPLLVVYYDVISDAEIAIVTKLANNSISRATVMGLNSSIVSPVRTSQFAFFPKTANKVLEIIDRRVEDMTNLNMTYSEHHQFANYGIGGHYGQHHDWFHVSKDKFKERIASSYMGNRIATVLFYLSDVEQGGGTAFPYMKQLLMPKKGSAAFWYNLHASGEGDDRTLHGACPIIVGSKWVQNRWIREFFQERRPCALFNDKMYGPF